jgi:hypothetical protein
MPRVDVVEVPEAFAAGPEYGLAIMRLDKPDAVALALAIQSPEGQETLGRVGFASIGCRLRLKQALWQRHEERNGNCRHPPASSWFFSGLQINDSHLDIHRRCRVGRGGNDCIRAGPDVSRRIALMDATGGGDPRTRRVRVQSPLERLDLRRATLSSWNMSTAASIKE